jgi:hypothetical protein
LLLLTHHETGLWGHSTLYLNSEPQKGNIGK